MRVEDARRRISELSRLNAFISLSQESGEGTVVAVKDLIDVRGLPTTAGGRLLSDTPATKDAPVVARLRRLGCLMVGKTNLHEFAYGVTSENSIHGDVRNPRDESRVAGGSSGGSAVAAATGMCDWAIGTDTGGSIRIPAALCGIVGIKPTRGLIDTTAVVPLSRTLDTLGPLAPDLATAVGALEAMSGLRGLLAPSPPRLSDLRLAVPAGWVEGLDAETLASWRLVSQGLPEIPFPSRAQLGQVSNQIMLPEASFYHRAWVQARSAEYGDPAVLDRLRAGLGVPAVDYIEGLASRARLEAEADAAMAGWDALLVPATACVAPPIGAANTREALARFTRAFNATAQPVVCLPAPASGLPVGIQVVGRVGEESRLVPVAQALEAAWRDLGPPG